jgi:hypothetical protein
VQLLCAPPFFLLVFEPGHPLAAQDFLSEVHRPAPIVLREAERYGQQLLIEFSFDSNDTRF